MGKSCYTAGQMGKESKRLTKCSVPASVAATASVAAATASLAAAVASAAASGGVSVIA